MYLEHINSPADLRRLAPEELDAVAAEIRELILDVVSRNGGHLGSSLGAVELVLALHYAFQTPRDRLLFDVGHQAYAHKIITGRREAFRTLRRFGGCPGFPVRGESEYDVCTAGHAGSAISAALGISAAMMREKSSDRAVALVGDASLTNAISLEGLNNARACGDNLVVVLNDNKMSIGENVGGMAGYLNRLISGGFYNRFKVSAKRVLRTLPRHERIHRAIRGIEDVIKNMVLPGAVFEELGFRYIGPINGHSLPDLVRTFRRVREFEGPVLVHVLTEKGHGCEFARREPARYHGVPGFDRATGEIRKSSKPSFSGAFGAAAVELAGKHPDVVAVTAAMCAGTGLAPFAERFPHRFYDVGIAEEHAVTFSGGLAAGGQRPICAVYATFMQRALDCIYHDVVLQRLPVIFALDRAGAVEDGPTHHGIYDLGFLRALPDFTVMAPKNEAELASMLSFAYDLGKPAAIRYPRGGSPADPSETPVPLEAGKAEIVKSGENVVIWATGPEVYTALEADRLCGGGATVVNARFLAPFDAELARRLAPGRMVVTIEDHVLSGGLASAMDDALINADHGRVLHFGWPAGPIPSGPVPELKAAYGLTAAAIAEKIRGAMESC